MFLINPDFLYFRIEQQNVNIHLNLLMLPAHILYLPLEVTGINISNSHFFIGLHNWSYSTYAISNYRLDILLSWISIWWKA